MNIIFYISAAAAVIATAMAITRKKAMHALLYLIVSLLSVAFIFVMLGAPFAAALELIIYAGAIMVLFVFVIMMLNLGKKGVEEEKRLMSGRVWLGPAILAFVLLIEFVYVFFLKDGLLFVPTVISPKKVAIPLFTTYLLGVELAGVLLMAGVIGAFHLGRQGRKSHHRFLKGDQE